MLAEAIRMDDTHKINTSANQPRLPGKGRGSEEEEEEKKKKKNVRGRTL